MTTLYVNFIWHMHQPYYIDTGQRRSLMPWVRLHAAKGYMDMARAVADAPGTKVTMNLTPCLIKQIRQRLEDGIKDDFELISEIPAADLTPSERAFILKFFFMANWDTLIKPNQEYYRLLNKRGTRGVIDFDEKQKSFTDQEMTDLVVWFNLAWTGWHAIEKMPGLSELREKGRGFTEEDKKFLLSCQLELLAQVIPEYKRLWDDGAIELSTTPMYHPILPLVYDTVLADRAKPGVRLPARFRQPVDASEHIRLGLDYMEESFGRRPEGMWPSEGSVAPELVPLFAKHGVRWIATDEAILWKKVRAHRRDEALFTPWTVREEDSELAVYFRDHGLSDLIGFTYSRQDPAQAADDMVRRFREIRSSISRLGRDHAVVSVILDGENPWEAYQDGGRTFLAQLYDGINKAEGIETITPTEYLERYPGLKELERLGTGSWIYGNFDIWIGGPEENRAWDYLGRARRELEAPLAKADEESKKEALDALYAGEGSDWFWWFGDFFVSDMDEEFDWLFRTHLKNAFMALGEKAPDFLDDPVKFTHSMHVLEEPVDLICPVIDGKVTNYYEWRCAGHVDLSTGGAMHQAARKLSHLYYGFDMENLFVRIDPNQEAENGDGVEIWIKVLSPVPHTIKFAISCDSRLSLEKDEAEISKTEGWEINCGKVIELRVPFDVLEMKAGDEARFAIEVVENGSQIERYPRDGFISFEVPDEGFEARHWSV